MPDHASKRPPADALSTAIDAARKEPAKRENWDLVEELVDGAQRPSDVRELFRDVLRGSEIPPAVAAEVGQRAVRFYEAWYGDDSTDLAELLSRVLERDSSAAWAFERLTQALTAAERWTDLLAAYDVQIEHERDAERRQKLLDEAAQLAKDFAGQPDRAIGYLMELQKLEPDNTTLAASLERLLERQARWVDLIGLWRARVEAQPPRQQRDTYLRMASCYLDALHDPASALRELTHIFADQPDYKPGLELAERILVADNAKAPERRDALRYLREHYQRAQKPQEVVRVLEAVLPLSAADDKRSLLRELTERALDLRDDGRAMRHQASLLVLEPMPKERDALRALSERTRNYEPYAVALTEAAAACAEPHFKVELLMEAARLREENLGQVEAAIEQYYEVFRAGVSADSTIQAGRRLLRLLEKTERERDTLDVLARMSELEPIEATRKSLLGRLAQLAEKLGDRDRARRAWSSRVGDDVNDLEALSALVDSAARDEDYLALAKLLRQRVQSPGAAHQRRDDLAWLARIYDEKLNDLGTAIETWRELKRSYKDDEHAVSALTELLARAERWDELAEALREAAQGEIVRFTELQTKLGDAYRARLDKPELAVLRYKSALQVDPAHVAAREGQQALLGNAACRATAVESLCEAYKATGEWQNELELLEMRLEVAPDAAARALLLTAAARAWEELGKAPERALDHYRRAFTLAPNDRETEREIRRLAAELDRWDAVVAAYRETIASFDKPAARVAELRYEEGQTLEQRLADRAGALEAYAQAAKLLPEREQFAGAAARVAAELGQWERAARELLSCAAAKGDMADVPFASIEVAAQSAGAFQAYCDGLAAGMRELGTQLRPGLRRAVLRYLARLQRDQLGDLAGAEAALASALEAQPNDGEILRELCATQRTLTSAGLFDSLRKLADIERDNLDPLWEAALLATQPAEAQRVLEALYERALGLWRRGQAPSGERSAQAAAVFAVDRMSAMYRAQSQQERALQLLVEATRLPFDAETQSRLMHEAAALALNVPGASSRAIALHRDLLAAEPGDPQALSALAKLYAQADRLPELLALRRHELSLDPKGGSRLELRLEIVRLLGELEARGDRLSALVQNLSDQPGHKPSLDALGRLLRDKGQFAELAKLYEAQARTLTGQGHRAEAAWLWREVAALRERELNDARAALAAYRELHELEPTGDASAALARLYASLGEHALAAEWLEIRLGSAPEQLRAATAVALARAHIDAGQSVQARACLEQALIEYPQLIEARELLADLYRQDGAYEPLAQVLSQGADTLGDAQRRLAYLREAADLYCDKLATPERAIPVLTRATELAPQDVRLRSMLAEGLRVAGRFDEAKAVLKALVDSFGRKRSPERAEFHYQTARVAASAGQFDEAFAELEQATKMDMGHQAALHMLAQLAQQQGDLDRAERAYRALLLLLRRQKNDDDQALGPAEVLFELYRLAQARNQDAQKNELLASAMEAAGQSELEARRFTRVLRARGAKELLLKVLDARLAAAREPKLEAELLSAKADLLEQEHQQPAAALELRLRAIALDEHADALHGAALALAVKSDELPRYLDVLTKLAEEAQRTRTPAGARSHARHLLRLGGVVEHQLKDFERAAGLYAKVEALGECTTEAWFSLARVAGARGDHAEQRRVLTRIAELDDSKAGKEEKNGARFLLAELELQEPEWRAQGIETLKQVLAASQDYARAKVTLSQALDRAPENLELLALCERVARASHDEPLLLNCIERRATLKGATLADVREGIEIALRRSDLPRAERLLERARTVYQADPSLAEDPTWVFSGLAQCRLQAKDTRGAMQYLREAIESAPESEAQALARELAQLASGPDGDLAIATETYARLLEREPADRSLWEPMLRVLMQLGDRAQLQSFVSHTLSALLMQEDRVFLLMAYANHLLEVSDDDAAARALSQLLEEEPTHLDATDKLLALYQRRGMQAELLALLHQQFDRARDERNVAAICELGLRLGKLYAESQPDQACDVLRAALEWQPEHRELLLTLLGLLPPDTDAREQTDLMLRLLKTETGERAAQLALDLAQRAAELGDEERVREALELGYRGAPDADRVREQLEVFYAQRELYRPMAELMQLEAARLGPGIAAIARLKNAAALYRDQLQDVDAAAGALRQALALDPNDLSLLGELARNLAAAGQHADAIADVTRLLDGHPEKDTGRGDLLRVRADLYVGADQPFEALADMEEAYAIVGASVLGEFLSALVRARDAARDSGADAMARSTSLRLIELLDGNGDKERARDELAALTELLPQDAELLAALRDRDLQEERYEEVVKSCQRLVALSEGKSKVDAVLTLAAAYEKLGHGEAALPWLLRVHEDAPEVMPLRERLRQLFTQLGQHRDLAVLLMGDAVYMQDPAEKVACWQRAAQLFLELGEAETAIDPLQKAMELAPEDDRTRLLLIDIDLSLGRVDTAAGHIEHAINAHKRRRSPELAQFQQRMARVCALRGDTESQLKWLNTALDTDRKSGEVASELVDAAIAIGDYDTAMKALRTLTMMEDPRPITRALAFLKQAEIALLRGDTQRAQHWARKAKSLDENLQAADELLARLGG